MNEIKSDIGNHYEFIEGIFANQPREMSFLNEKWNDLKPWKDTARAKLLDLLSYFPPAAPLSPAVLSTQDHGAYIREEVEFNTSALTRVSGSVLIPKNGAAPYPAVVAIHDHGGFYYFGREKILDTPDMPGPLESIKNDLYKGRSWASDLARRGYLVLVIDAFMFGKRRLDYDAMSDTMRKFLGNPLDGEQKGSDRYIWRFNDMCSRFETQLVKQIFHAGASWAGILSHDDRASVDYLLSRNDVDPARVGCCGLSIGGYRSALLAATDPRLSCAVVAGWMPTTRSLLRNHLWIHTYMVIIPGLARYMELPDLAGLAAPNHLFVQQCREDFLYTEEGMRDACDGIQAVYGKAGAPDNFRSKFYDCSHEFNIDMQQDAFAWIEKHL